MVKYVGGTDLMYEMREWGQVVDLIYEMRERRRG